MQVNKIPLTYLAPDKVVKVKEHNVRDSSTISILLIYQVFLLFSRTSHFLELFSLQPGISFVLNKAAKVRSMVILLGHIFVKAQSFRCKSP